MWLSDMLRSGAMDRSVSSERCQVPDSEAIEREVERNYAAFMAKIAGLLRDHREGQYAVMRHQDVVEFFDSAGDAVKFGNALYEDRLFSVQEVTGKPLDLGYFSHGGPYSDI